MYRNNQYRVCTLFLIDLHMKLNETSVNICGDITIMRQVLKQLENHTLKDVTQCLSKKTHTTAMIGC